MRTSSVRSTPWRCFGCSAAGWPATWPACRLAILPGTTHSTVPQRAEWLAPMIDEFLDEV
ncbi:hypothetical protein [Micromonospora sp. NPDC057141]|uniref:hypothetical protein n=1 Tax=Micromonospora sp. NPDC057141 TaxID=3346033 RepID=UPI00362F599B